MLSVILSAATLVFSLNWKLHPQWTCYPGKLVINYSCQCKRAGKMWTNWRLPLNWSHALQFRGKCIKRIVSHSTSVITWGTQVLRFSQICLPNYIPFKPIAPIKPSTLRVIDKAPDFFIVQFVLIWGSAHEKLNQCHWTSWIFRKYSWHSPFIKPNELNLGKLKRSFYWRLIEGNIIISPHFSWEKYILRLLVQQYLF